jgi:hypothetical protein
MPCFDILLVPKVLDIGVSLDIEMFLESLDIGRYGINFLLGFRAI